VGAVADALRILRGQRVDVVVAFQFHAFILARLIARAAGVRAVVSSIRTERDEPVRERMTALTDRLSRYTVVNGNRVARDVVRRGIVSPDRIRIILNAVEVEPSSAGRGEPPDERSRMRRTLGLPPDGMLWINVARLVKEKDHQTLLAAMRTVVAKHPESRLLLVGDGPLRGEVEATIERLNLSDHVTILGHRTDVHALLQCADAFVLSSSREGSPNALLEAMAMGLPCVSTDVGGVPDLIPSQEEGSVVPAGNASALADAMSSLMERSASERALVAARGRRRVLENHGLEGVVASWQQLIGAAATQR